MSPILLKPIAENADEVVSEREDHVPMSKKLITPTISQPTRKTKLPEEFKASQTENKKAMRRNPNAVYWLSNSRYAEKHQRPRRDEMMPRTSKFQTEQSWIKVPIP
jgi:hypothetical protein